MMPGYDLSLAAENDAVYTRMGPLVFSDGQGAQDTCMNRRTLWGETKYLPPVFAKDIPGSTKASRRYTCCSYRQMYEHLRGRHMSDRIYYELIVHDQPCRFYIDVDYAHRDLRKGSRPPDVNEGIVVFLRLLEQAKQTIFAHSKDPAWDFDWKDVQFKTLSADREEKQSRHVVFQMPQLRLLENGHEHVKRWYKMVIRLSREEFGHDNNNPLFYEHVDGTSHCFFDSAVYTPNRIFRMIGNVKYKDIPVGASAFLFPACEHAAELSCEEVNCRFRVQLAFSEYEFLSNLVSFIPLEANGDFQTPTIMRVPDFFDEDLAKSARLKYSTIKYPSTASSPIMPFMRFFGSDNSNHSFASTICNNNNGSSNGASALSRRAPACRAIMDEIAAMLTRQTRHACNYLYENDGGVHIFQTTSKECPLKGIYHKNNHVTIVCRLALPFPQFNIICRDPDCLPYMELKKGMTIEQRERVRRFALDADPTIFAPITAMIAEHILQNEVTSDVLMLGFVGARMSSKV